MSHIAGGSGAVRRLAVVMAAAAVASASLPGQSPARSDRVLRYGFTARVNSDSNPNDAKAASLVWAKGITEQVGVWSSAEAHVFPDADAAVATVDAGKTDIVALTTMEYLGVERRLRATPSLIFISNNQAMTEFVLLTRSDVKAVGDIAGRRLAMHASPAPDDLSDLWLNVLLLEAGLPGKAQAFGSIRMVPKKSQAAMALYFKQADVALETTAAFETAVELNPQLGRELRVLARSPKLLPGLLCLRDSLDPAVRRQYVEKASRLHELPQFRQSFILLQVTRLDEWQPWYLDSVRALVARYETLKKKAPRQ